MTTVFTQCFGSRPSPVPRKRVIDLSMIGNPTNFQHTAHVGSNDVSNGSSNMDSLQSQMQTKGGYGQSSCSSHFKLVDVQKSMAS